MSIHSDLHNRLKSDFTANVMNHIPEDSRTIVIQEVLNPTNNGEDVISNSLNRYFSNVDRLLSRETPVETVEETVTEAQETQELPSQGYFMRNSRIKQTLQSDLAGSLNNTYMRLSNHVMRVVFYKVDGSTRVMWCTKNPDIIEEFGASPQSKPKFEMDEERQKQILTGKVKVFDLENKAWRQVNFERIIGDVEDVALTLFPVETLDWVQLFQKEVLNGEDIRSSLLLTSNIAFIKIPELGNIPEGVSYASLLDGTYNGSEQEANEQVEVSRTVQPLEIPQAPQPEPEPEPSPVVEQRNVLKEIASGQEAKAVALNSLAVTFHALQNNIARMTFVKKDGTYREMWCTKNHAIVDSNGGTPVGNKTSEEMREENLKQIRSGSFTVFDIEAKGWRRVNINTLASNETYPIVFFDIDKPLWAEILKGVKDINQLNSPLRFDDFKFEIEQSIPSVDLHSFEIDAMIEQLIGTTISESSNSRLKVSEYIRNHPEVALDMLKQYIVRADFTKRDGTSRTIYATRNVEMLESLGLEIDSDKEEQEIEKGMFRVLDVELGELRYLNIDKLSSLNEDVPFMVLPLMGSILEDLMKPNADVFGYFQANKSNNLAVIDNEIEGTEQEISIPDLCFGVSGQTHGGEEASEAFLPISTEVLRKVNEKYVPNFQEFSNPEISERYYNIDKYMFLRDVTKFVIPPFMNFGFREATVRTQFQVNLISQDNKVGLLLNTNGATLYFVSREENKILPVNIAKQDEQVTRNNKYVKAKTLLLATNIYSEEQVDRILARIHHYVYDRLPVFADINRRNNILNTKDETIVQKMSRVNQMIALASQSQTLPENKMNENIFLKSHLNSILVFKCGNLFFTFGDGKLYVESNEALKLIHTFEKQTSFNQEYKVYVEKIIQVLKAKGFTPQDIEKSERILTKCLLNPINLRYTAENMVEQLKKD